MGTLLAQHVERHLTPLGTVIAEDFDFFVSKFFWHWGLFNFRVQLDVEVLHVAETLEAEGALVLVLGEFLETVLVHAVSAVKKDGWVC